MAWKICNYRNGFLLLLSGAGLAGSAHSMEGFEEERRVIEEIIVIGTPPSSADISVIGGWFSFATVDLSDQFRSLDYFLGALRVANSNLIEASEQYCSHKIEGWRRDCHAGMRTAHTYCIVSGAFLTGSLIRARVPEPFRSSGSIGSGFGTLTACNGIRFRAHRNCDRIADSDAAPRIAGCPGH